MGAILPSTTKSGAPAAQPKLTEELRRIHAGRFCLFNGSFHKSLEGHSVASISGELDTFFGELLGEEDPTKILPTLERLANLIPLDKLTENPEELLKEAQTRLEAAKLCLDITDDPTHASLTCYNRVVEALLAAIDNFLRAFGIADIFKPSDNTLQADMKSQKLLMLLHLFMMLTTLLIPILAPSTAGYLIGGILFGIAALSLIFPLIRPATSSLPADAENVTDLVREKNVSPQIRRKSRKEMARILKTGRHVLLTGQSRVGKSKTVEDFAQACLMGNYGKELQEMTVFRISAADLVGRKASFMGGGNQILKEISDAMGRNRDKIILVIEEIHTACMAEGKVAEQFKKFLDVGGSFPHVIGITTDKEFDEFVKANDPFVLRFDKVEIKTTGEKGTSKVLNRAFLRHRRKPHIRDEAILSEIYRRTIPTSEGDLPQPTAALQLLERTISHVTGVPETAQEKDLEKKENQIQGLKIRAGISFAGGEIDASIKKLEEEISSLEMEVAEQEGARKRLLRMRQFFTLSKEKMFEATLNISKVSPSSKKFQKNLKLFLLLRSHLLPAMEEMVYKQSKDLGVNFFIDEDVIAAAMKAPRKEEELDLAKN